jgi:hypothetical protein
MASMHPHKNVMIVYGVATLDLLENGDMGAVMEYCEGSLMAALYGDRKREWSAEER